MGEEFHLPGPSEKEGKPYVVLARRYRPAQLAELVGQEHVVRTLKNAIAQGRVHHAYLFTGSRGVGKTTVARILAKALNCERGPTAQPCDSCDSCKDIREGRSVDVYEIDGASHTGVDDVRELRDSVRYLPARSRYKVIIIDEVHMLSTSAFNALLKTLEEPPPHVVFIFATTEPHKILATILSRCQRFDFKRVPAAMLIQHLTTLCEREGLAVEPEGLTLIARASEGSVRDSLSLLDQVFAYATGAEAITGAQVADVLGVTDRRVLFALTRALLERDAQRALGLVAELFAGGQDLSQFAQAYLGHLRDLTVVRTCPDPGPLLDATLAELQDMQALATAPGAEILPQHFDRFARTAEDIARSPVPRLLLEMAIVEMVQAEPMVPLGDLLDRLEQLEGRLGGAGSHPPSGGGSRGGPTRFTPEPAAAPARGRGRSVPSPTGGGPEPWERDRPGSRKAQASRPVQDLPEPPPPPLTGTSTPAPRAPVPTRSTPQAPASIPRTIDEAVSLANADSEPLPALLDKTNSESKPRINEKTEHPEKHDINIDPSPATPEVEPVARARTKGTAAAAVPRPEGVSSGEPAVSTAPAAVEEPRPPAVATASGSIAVPPSDMDERASEEDSGADPAAPSGERPSVHPEEAQRMQAWQDLLHRVEQTQPVAASPFFSGKLLSWDGPIIRLGYLPGSFGLDLAADRDRLERFQAECQRQLGTPITVEVRSLTPHEDTEGSAAHLSAMEDRERQRQSRARRLRREAETHPLTLAFLQDFGATIESITTEMDEP